MHTTQCTPTSITMKKEVSKAKKKKLKYKKISKKGKKSKENEPFKFKKINEIAHCYFIC